MTGSEMPRRRRTGGVLPGMPPDPPAPETSPTPAANTPPTHQRQRATPPPPQSRHLTFGGERKEHVNIRLYPSLWQAYEQLLLELRPLRPRTSGAELFGAILYFNLPANLDDATALIARYRDQVLAADPPSDV